MQNTVLAIKSLWASGEDRCVLLGSLETEGLVASEAEGETDCNVVVAEALADPTGPSKLSEIESRVRAFYSHIRQSLAVGYPGGEGIILSKTVSRRC